MTNPYSLLAQVLKAKYYPTSDFITSNLKPNASCFDYIYYKYTHTYEIKLQSQLSKYFLFFKI